MPSETPWTPGPWKTLDGKYGPQIHSDSETCNHWIANLKCESCPAHEDANARLIAAAPQMAELLGKWLRAFSHQDDDAMCQLENPTDALLTKIKDHQNDR